MIIELIKTFTFEAAHSLPKVPDGHKCRRIHGHSFTVELTVRGEVDEELGWLMDYEEITSAFRPIREQLDHHLLNEIPGLENATSENLARFIWERLLPDLPLLTCVEIAETCQSRCRYFGQ